MTAGLKFELRAIQRDDLETICRHRREMFRSSGRDEPTLSLMTEHFRPWLASRLEEGTYFGWLAISGGVAVAGVGMMAIPWPPHPSHPTRSDRGYVLNLYVEPTHRGRGLGRRLMGRCEAEAQRRGLQYAVLHATEQGRGLYEALGWSPTSEMALFMGDPS